MRVVMYITLSNHILGAYQFMPHYPPYCMGNSVAKWGFD